jgi:CPA2 family monovalent cation:H+ antiporter-2
MLQDSPLLAMLAIGFSLAFLFGATARRLGLPAVAGYLLAGIMVGPFTPGFVANPHLATELADVGIILLMFGIGLHFSIQDLLTVKWPALGGAIGQIMITVGCTMALAIILGWGWMAGVVFGLALAVASTAVVIRALEERHLQEAMVGRTAVAWLVVEDVIMVLALLFLPLLWQAGGQDGVAGGQESQITQLLWMLLQWLGFAGLLLVLGRWVVPWVLRRVAEDDPRELFTLAVLAMALGIAFAAARLFGVSFALGAFLAGVVLNLSPYGHRAAQDSLPFRDAFAVLFFVSAGMLLNPRIFVTEPLLVAAVLLVVVIIKPLSAYALARFLGCERDAAWLLGAAVGQIGEFSFIMAGLAVSRGLLPREGHDAILAAAVVSIALNPLLFHMAGRLGNMAESPGRIP